MALSDAFSNAAPIPQYMFRSPLTVAVCASVNVTIAGQASSVFDGYDLSGPASSAKVLLTGQTLPAQNGPYSINSDVTDPLSGVTIPGTLNGSGTAQITGLIPGKLYYITGTAGIGVNNGVVTIADVNATPAMIAPTAGGILTVTGANNGSLATLFVFGSKMEREASYNGSDEWPHLNQFVVTNGAANSGRWVCTTAIPIVIDTTALAFTKKLATPASI